MILSAKGSEFVAAFEGFRAYWYDDGTGVKTIGIGHTGPLPAGFSAPLSPLQAHLLLQRDARSYESAANAFLYLPGGLTQAQYDALVSIAYNSGAGCLRPGGAISKALRSKPRLPWPANVLALKLWHRRVQAAFELWDHAGGQVLPGLWRRRRAEATLFATGKYTRAQGNSYANA